MGKGEIARYEQFLLFPQCFQKACFPGTSKGVIVWEWVNPFKNKPWFLRDCSASLLKTLWEKNKLLRTSNFFFSHSVFQPILRDFWHFHQTWNWRLQTLSVWRSPKFVVWESVKIVRKEENACNQHFLLFPHFLSHTEEIPYFESNICHLVITITNRPNLKLISKTHFVGHYKQNNVWVSSLPATKLMFDFMVLKVQIAPN